MGTIHVYLVAGIHPIIEAPGGTRSYVLGLVRALSRRGFEVSLVGAGPPVPTGFADFLTVSPNYPISNYTFIRRLWTWLRWNPPEKGSIVNAMRPDDLYPYRAFRERCLLVCTLHGTPAQGVAQRRSIGRLLYRYAESRALKSAHRVISVSEVTHETYARRYPQLTRKSCVIPVGVDLSAFRPLDRQTSRRSLGLPDVPSMLFAGRLVSEKRVRVPIEAVKGIRDGPRLLIAGRGPEEAALRTCANGAPVSFLGGISHDQMPSVFSAADALVVPSAFEGLPTVALEALACGTPVISTAVGDLPRVLNEGSNGLFFDGTVKGLRHVILRRWDSLHLMRARCVETVKAFSWDSIADRVAEVYRRAR